MKLEYNPGDKPLWKQVYDIILNRILTKEYKIYEKLPTEKDFMDEFHVSRITVRKAMEKLINESFIERKRGKGTIVINKDFSEKVETRITSTTSKIEEFNDRNNRKFLSIELVKPNEELVKIFKISNNEKVICINRVSVINNRIVGHHVNYINPIVNFSDDFKEGDSIYSKLKELNYEISNVEEEISSHIISESEKKLFEIKTTKSIIERKIKGFSNNILIEYSIIKYISDDYKYIIKRTI